MADADLPPRRAGRAGRLPVDARRRLVAPDRAMRGGSLANDANLREENGDWPIQGDSTEATFLVAEIKRAAGTGGLNGSST
jgi:hypothetical protein